MSHTDRQTMFPCPFCAAQPEAPNARLVVCRAPDCVISGFWLPLDGWNTRTRLVPAPPPATDRPPAPAPHGATFWLGEDA